MIKAILSDLYKVVLFPKPGAPRYDPVGFNLNESCEVNKPYLELISNSGLPVFILTNYRNSLMDPDLNSILNTYKISLFEAPILGLDKASSYAYEFIAKNKLGINPQEIAVIDDLESNVAAAARAGAIAIRYESNEQIAKWLNTLN